MPAWKAFWGDVIMESIKVAAYQMKVGADIDANLAKIRGGIEKASAAGAKIIALPECALPGYPPDNQTSQQDIDHARIAELNGEVCDIAAEFGIWVILGTIVMSSEGLLNSALVIADTGEIVGRYDKLHLMPGDRNIFMPGVGAWTFDLADGVRFGVLICYDVRFPEPFRYLREEGAQVIFVILNACGGETWKLPVLEGTFRARAAENSCFIVAANAAGPLQMATSRIVNPLGLDLASANQDREEMIFAHLDMSKADAGYFYDRRLDQFMVKAMFGPEISGS